MAIDTFLPFVVLKSCAYVKSCKSPTIFKNEIFHGIEICNGHETFMTFI